MFPILTVSDKNYKDNTKTQELKRRQSNKIHTVRKTSKWDNNNNKKNQKQEYESPNALQDTWTSYNGSGNTLSNKIVNQKLCFSFPGGRKVNILKEAFFPFNVVL